MFCQYATDPHARCNLGIQRIKGYRSSSRVLLSTIEWLYLACFFLKLRGFGLNFNNIFTSYVPSFDLVIICGVSPSFCSHVGQWNLSIHVKMFCNSILISKNETGNFRSNAKQRAIACDTITDLDLQSDRNPMACIVLICDVNLMWHSN